MLQSGWYVSTCTRALVSVCVSVYCYLQASSPSPFCPVCVLCCTHKSLQALLDVGVDADEEEGEKGSSAHVQYFIHATQAIGKQQLSRSVHQFVSFAPIAIYTCVCMCARVCEKVRSHTHAYLDQLRTHTNANDNDEDKTTTR